MTLRSSDRLRATLPPDYPRDIPAERGDTRVFYMCDDNDLGQYEQVCVALLDDSRRGVVLTVSVHSAWVDVLARADVNGGVELRIAADRPHTRYVHPAVDAVREHAGEGWRRLSKLQDARYDVGDSEDELVDIFQVRDDTDVLTLKLRSVRIRRAVVTARNVLMRAHEMASAACINKPCAKWVRRLRR